MIICSPDYSLQGGEFLVQGSLISLGAPQAGWQMPIFQAPAASSTTLLVSSPRDPWAGKIINGFRAAATREAIRL